MIGVAPRVQDLHADAPAFRMHGVGHEPMPGEVAAAAQRAGKRLGPARRIRRDAAGHDESDAAARALGEVGGELRIVVARGPRAPCASSPSARGSRSVVKPRSSGASRCGNGFGVTRAMI